MSQIQLSAIITEEHEGMRVDQCAASMFEQFSRGQLKKWIDSGELTLNGEKVKPKLRVACGQTLQLCATPADATFNEPQELPLDVVYEDESLLVINKPVGLVVHPGAGNPSGTLVNALLFYDPKLSQLPRAGLVHRIDKDTSGLMVVAKTDPARLKLQAQLKDKTVYRNYLALCHGALRSTEVHAAVGRHPVQRVRMAVVDNGKDAVSHFKVIERLQMATLFEAKLETGRTHQIRVHAAHLGHALWADPLYQNRQQKNRAQHLTPWFERQALHAYELGFVHPETSEPCQFQAPLPSDFLRLLTELGSASFS